MKYSLSIFTLQIIFILTAKAAEPLPHSKPVGPSPYLGFSAEIPGVGQSFSPFFNLQDRFEYFYLEDFEDVKLNIPGVSVGRSITGKNTLTNDSVDADDGKIDGFGREGGSIFDQHELSFEFSEKALGYFPTHVGLVITDSHPQVTIQVEFFGADGNSLGALQTVFGDGDFLGGTEEDRFLGWIAANGIARVLVTDLGAPNGIELDHLQYGKLSDPSLDPISGNQIQIEASSLTPWGPVYQLESASILDTTQFTVADSMMVSDSGFTMSHTSFLIYHKPLHTTGIQPELSISLIHNKIVLSHIITPDEFTLQSTTDLESGLWEPVSISPQFKDGLMSYSLYLTNNHTYFRLKPKNQ